MTSIDVLMITFNSADYVQRSLPRLLESCTDDMRVWVWHNGTDEATLAAVTEHVDDPRVARFHHSPENARLLGPTQWLWAGSRADLVGKVDDDCLVDLGWAERFAQVHRDWDRLGAIGSWRFYEEDFVEELAAPKIRTGPGGHRIMQNAWVQGSGYLMKREVIERFGGLRPGLTFTQYCKRIARRGYVNGYHFPFVCEDHMDDPRSPNTGLRSDADLRKRLPLSAQARGINTLEDWTRELRASALSVQAASADGSEFSVPARLRRRAQRVLSRSPRSAGLGQRS